MDLQSTNVDPSVLNFTQSVESTHQIEMDDKSNSISVSFDEGIETTLNERLGRFCKLPDLKKCPTKISRLRENSFQVRAPQLFNSLPKELRDKSKCSLEDFKELLDNHLSRIPDEPNLPGDEYTPSRVNHFDAKPTNSIIGYSSTHGA